MGREQNLAKSLSPQPHLYDAVAHSLASQVVPRWRCQPAARRVETASNPIILRAPEQVTRRMQDRLPSDRELRWRRRRLSVDIVERIALANGLFDGRTSTFPLHEELEDGSGAVTGAIRATE